MKLFVIILVSIVLQSNNLLTENAMSVDSKNRNGEMSTVSTKKEKGVIKNHTYICSIYDWSISIPKKYTVYYPERENKKSSEIPEVIENQINENLLVSFGVDEKNYLSAYLESTTELQSTGSSLKEIITNPVNSFRDTSRKICADLEARYSANRQIAFKQNWKNVHIKGINYDIYDIQLVLYPEGTPIVSQIVYVRREKDNNIHFSVIYTNEDDKEILMQKLTESLQ